MTPTPQILMVMLEAMETQHFFPYTEVKIRKSLTTRDMIFCTTSDIPWWH